MNSILGSLGALGLAAVLTILLYFGTQPGGKAKQLGWGLTFFLSLLAGAAYNAAGTPFDLVSSLVNDLLGLVSDTFPGITQAAVALGTLIVAFYAKMSTRQVAIAGILLFYFSSGSGGALAIVAEKIALIMQNLAS